MPSGKVKWFNSKKGYGFITDDETNKDIFLHVSALESSKLRVLKEEQKIKYDIKEEKDKLQAINISAKVVSMPCQELFDKQSKEYKENIIEKNSIKISVEASSTHGWEKYVGPKGFSLGMKSFGKSAPIKDLYEHFNLTSNNVVEITKRMLGK